MTENSERLLLAMTVYNGREFVPDALASARRLTCAGIDIDVLVLDDASPDVEWSRDLCRLCEEAGAGYYRTPRNLGITRNVNLGLLQAVRGGYDYVVISNSDVLFPQDLIEQLLAAQRSDPKIGSVTAWSNNVSIYSLPNADPDANLRDQEVVDWLGRSLGHEYSGTAIDVPVGVSFCVLVRTEVVNEVGLMDPVFGRGYCEETDWTLRSLAYGYRVTLAPAAFVYHRGRGSTVEAGMVQGNQTTVACNEAIIDHRYPLFRGQVQAFIDGGILDELHAWALRRVVSDAGKEFGYVVEVAWVAGLAPDAAVRVVIRPDPTEPMIQATYRGFTCELAAGHDVADTIRQFFGGTEPRAVVLSDRGPAVTRLADAFDVPTAARHPRYPTKV